MLLTRTKETILLKREADRMVCPWFHGH